MEGTTVLPAVTEMPSGISSLPELSVTEVGPEIVTFSPVASTVNVLLTLKFAVEPLSVVAVIGAVIV